MCEPNYFCHNKNNITYEIDYDDEISLNNWVQEFDLVCASSFTISSFGMIFFAGYAIGSAIIPKLADLYGRKRPFFAINVLSLISLIIIVTVPQLQIVLMCLFLIGLVTSGNFTIGICYMGEFVPEGYDTMLTSYWNGSEGMIAILCTL